MQAPHGSSPSFLILWSNGYISLINSNILLNWNLKLFVIVSLVDHQHANWMFGVHQYVSSWFANELLCVSYMMLVSCVLTCQCNGVGLSSPHPIISFFLYIPICFRLLQSINLYIIIYNLCTLCNSHYLSRFVFQTCEVCGLTIFQKRIKPSLATC